MAGIFGDDPRSRPSLTFKQLLEALDPPPPPPLSPGVLGQALSGPPFTASFGLGGILSESARRRSAWNDRFEHWQKPASVTEEGTIDRAWLNVTRAIAENAWFNEQGVTIVPQGSYHNNTNVRAEADIDLRAAHRALRFDYGPGVVVHCARTVLGYYDYGMTFQQIFDRMRGELSSDLSRRFGAPNVAVGKKAIRIKGITGSRAEVDVVPAIRYHHITWNDAAGRYETIEGAAILGTDGSWTINYPERHTANGITKRARTRHRFKKVVRILKRMRVDMEDWGILTVKVPSFLVECLVYLVEDEHFLVDGDDRYGRVRRVALRLQEILRQPFAEFALREINEAKPLFGPDQAWSYADAVTFVDTLVRHLGDA